LTSLVAFPILVAVPGLGATMALDHRGKLALPTRLALVAVLGYGVVGAVAYFLVVLRILRAPVFFGLLAAVTSGLWILALRRFGPRDRMRRLVEDLRRDPWILVGVLVIVAIAVVRLLSLPKFQSEPAAFRYWFDGLELADAGRVPALTVQYGGLYPPAISKIFLSAFSAGASFVARDPLPAMRAVMWVASVGLALALWSLGWELGLRFMAPLLPLLLVSNRVLLGTELTRDLGAYRAEVVGRMVAFAGAAMAIRAIRDRERRDAVIAGLILAIGVATHLVPVVVAGIVVAWYLLARAVLDRTLAGIRASALRGAIVAGVTAVVGLAILVIPPGDIGLHVGPRPTEAAYSFDTGFFLRFGRMRPPTPAGQAWYVPPNRLFEDDLGNAFGVTRERTLASLASKLRVALPLGGLVLALVALLWFPSELRPAVLVSWGLGMTLFGIAVVFSHHYHTYIPGTFGARRMFDYAMIPVFLGGLALMEVAVHLLGRIRPWAGIAAAAVVVVLAAVLVLPTGRLPTGGRTYRDAIAMLSWIREHTPCDARILANERSAAVFKSTTGRIGVIEGMAPYLRPEMTTQVLPLVLQTREFFHHPLANRSFLERRDVDYVVVVRLFLGIPDVVGHVNTGELARAPFLQPVFQTPRAQVYRVTGLTQTERRPALGDAPGIRCGAGPVPT